MCRTHNVGSSTVYNIKSQKNEILKIYTISTSKRCLAIHKTLKEGTSSELGKALIQQFKLHWTGHFPILGDMIMAQAQIFCKELNLQHECEYFQG